jgi:hypothetical protein
MSSVRQKPEDSADGCRARAASNREQAAATANEHVRATFERSAEAWTERASLLDRLEARFNARAAENVAGQPTRLGMETREDG